MATPGDNASIDIRTEQPSDLDGIRELNRQAFGQEQEGRIVDALRANGAALLSLVALAEDAVVGHILFSPLTVGPVTGAALGPMAVLPSHQRRGIGSQLVERGLERLRADGCPFVGLIGHPEFYPRFGFRPATDVGMTCEWEVPVEAFMVTVLDPGVTNRLAGRAAFRTEFPTIE